jgi:hypothetical protein
VPDLAELIGELLGAQEDLGVTDITLTKEASGARTPGSLVDGTNAAPTDYTGRGFIEGAGQFMDGTLVKQPSVKISVFGSTISSGAIPEAGDRITIRSKTYKVVRTLVDPVGAVYECEAQ